MDNDITIVCAAISDYSPEKLPGKIPSGEPELSLALKPTPKVIAAIREADSKTYLVGFKAEADVSQQELLERAINRLESSGLQMIVANDLKDVSAGHSLVHILMANGSRYEFEGAKSAISGVLFDEIIADLGSEKKNDNKINYES
jgi:phosphopantothenoylcysteine decarboxylase/phosphopantothenate--cysteine ligase